MARRDFGMVDYDALVAQEPVAVLGDEAKRLPILGSAWDRLQSFATYRVQEYQGKPVIAMSAGYGRPPFTIYPLPQGPR